MPTYHKDYYELIAWTAGNNAYTTGLYREADHESDFPDGVNVATYWTINLGTTLTSHYFREYYIFDFKTYFTDDQIIKPNIFKGALSVDMVKNYMRKKGYLKEEKAPETTPVEKQ